MTSTYSVLHLFCGIGGGALGFAKARGEWRGMTGRFRTLAGIDFDPACCRDFEALTGARATCADLATMQPAELLKACGGEAPDVVFSSPPCQGFSGLLSTAKSNTEHYQALNRLVLQGLWLVLETFRDAPPKLILVENVPRITTRGALLLQQVRALLGSYGYAFHESTHDAGELGGLGQHRRRFLLVARHVATCPTYLYQPAVKPLLTVGDVLGKFPMPDATECGPMHRLPRLAWRTWVRLALIPAGGDWRSLNDLGPDRGQPFNNTWAVVPWSAPSGAVTSGSGPSSSGVCVADPRLSERAGRFKNKYRVTAWNEPADTVTGARDLGQDAACVADPRWGKTAQNAARFSGCPGLYGVARWDEPISAITGSASATGSNATACVADPRVECSPRNGTLGVLAWDQPSGAVIGSADIHAGAHAVADPRIPADDDRPDPPPVIVALDGTWHRPLTTLELAALQGLPVTMPDGSPLVLDGKSDARWRKAIGNCVPPPAAAAVAGEMLRTLLSSGAGVTFEMMPPGRDVWVRHERRAET